MASLGSTCSVAGVQCVFCRISFAPGQTFKGSMLVLAASVAMDACRLWPGLAQGWLGCAFGAILSHHVRIFLWVQLS